MKTDVMEQVKIITPAAIMVTRLHLIDPGFAIVDCGDAVFDPGTEHEVCDDLGPPFRAALRRTAQPGKGTSSIPPTARSEEHTSELQSLMRISYAVFCLKKK